MALCVVVMYTLGKIPLLIWILKITKEPYYKLGLEGILFR